jgi:hypothetical protein
MRRARVILISAAAAAFATSASARIVDEVRIGVAAHNVSFGDSDSSQSDETGPDLEFELISQQVRLGLLGAPRVHTMLSINLHGDTSYAAAGLSWRWRFAENWTLEPGLGIAVHDGALDNPYPSGDPRAVDYARSHQLLGARVLFRETLAVDRRLDERHSIGVSFAHLSNGGALFGNEDNQSLNEIALRYTMRR